MPSAGSRRRAPDRALRLLAAAVLLLVGTPRAEAGGDLVPPAAYYEPVLRDGRTFPVARSNWYSVIEFQPDWHDPRFRLIDGTWQLVGVHEGLDIIAEEGTPIHAMAPGRVENVGWTFYSGTRVGIRGHDGRYYFYAHLSSLAPGMTEGAAVEAGDTLGAVGNTGYGPPGHRDEFPPHLHLGIQDGEEWVNPHGEVRRLYRAAATVTARAERRLARLAEARRAEEWERLAGRLYAEAE